MLQLLRTDSENPGYAGLVKRLDAYLAEKDGAEHPFYAQFNTSDRIRHVVVAYEDGKPVGCGAIREFSPGIMEIKRMYTIPECRGKGIATRILDELEQWSAELSYGTCILETGKRQTEAMSLYEKHGYARTRNFGPYAGVENSICYEKRITGR